jgi:hypothetical protein
MSSFGPCGCHCVAKWKKARNQVSPDHVPNISVKNISMTLQRIWVAKAATIGGASGSKQSIFEVLISSSGHTGEAIVSRELGLGPVHQNGSHSLEEPSLHLPPPSPAQSSGQECEMAFQRDDPRPFVPLGFHHLEVHHRATIVHAVMHPPP